MRLWSSFAELVSRRASTVFNEATDIESELRQRGFNGATVLFFSVPFSSVFSEIGVFTMRSVQSFPLD
jgi:hypothetical protein